MSLLSSDISSLFFRSYAAASSRRNRRFSPAVFSRAFYSAFLLLTNAGRCATIKVSKDRIYHSLSAVFGHKSQVSWVSWLPADEIDFSALLFFGRAFYLHFAIDKCLRIWNDIGGLEISVAHPVQRIINVRLVIYCRLSAVSDISRYFLQRQLLPPTK